MAKKFELQNGFGNLFKNKNKEGKQPDMFGQVKTPDGHLWEVAAWSKETKEGDRFLSIKTQEPQKNSDGGGKKSKEEDDDLPF